MSHKELLASAEGGEHVRFFRHVFLPHDPGRFAVMMPEHSSRKYIDYAGKVTDELLQRHLDGSMTLAVPAAWNGLAAYLPLDVDRGGLPCLQTLMEEAARRNLWSFGQYSPRPRWSDEEQRGYVWIVFNELTNAARLQRLGGEIIAAVGRKEWNIEARAHGADTRLPLGKHTHSLSFGYLLLPAHEVVGMDMAPTQAVRILQQQLQENSVDLAPRIVEGATKKNYRWQQPLATIEQFNREHDVEELLCSYGARRAGRKLYHCPFHHDVHASLIIYTDRRGTKVCRCLSAQSECPLSSHGRYDAFNVYSLGERLRSSD